MQEYLVVEKSGPLSGEVSLCGAKNAVLVIMTSLILTRGRSVLHNVPAIEDVYVMMTVLQELGAVVVFDKEHHMLTVDTTELSATSVRPELMKKMRASVLVMGPLLARIGHVMISLPGGDAIGARPIDYHLKNLAKLGAVVTQTQEAIEAHCTKLTAAHIVLEYPSVGATENILMAATMARGITKIVNAALEPEVYDLITVLKKMGAKISLGESATIIVEGVQRLYSVEHTIIPDRLEAGSLLIASAITGGEILLPNARHDHLDLVLAKLEEMGHIVHRMSAQTGVRLVSMKNPNAVSIKTTPYPGFPTDLQAPMMAAQAVARGTCTVEETVFENRFQHVQELNAMGAQIEIVTSKAIVKGMTRLDGKFVKATDIRASCALVLAGLVADGQTIIDGVNHWRRGYDELEKKLSALGANIACKPMDIIPNQRFGIAERAI